MGRIELRRGDNNTVTMTIAVPTIVDGVTVSTTPVNLTGLLGATLRAKRYKTDADSAALITKSLGNGITVIDAANGILTVAFAPADYATITDEVLEFALKLKSASNIVSTVAEGSITLLQTAVNTVV
jgi:hypothetical protein